MLDSHLARANAQRKLKILGEIQPQNPQAVKLIGGVVGFVAEPRVVADPVKPFGRVFLEEKASLERPPLLARAASLVVDVDVTRNLLLPTGSRVPVSVLRWIRKKTEGSTGAQGGVGFEVRCEDISNLIFRIGVKHCGEDSDRGATVRVGRDFRDWNEGPGVGIFQGKVMRPLPLIGMEDL